jgi:chloramphenicol 3-O phosphotransferase
MELPESGLIVVLNGVPRSGKSSIAQAMQDSFEGVWMNLGVDLFSRHMTPARYHPGIGLRPGGERPDLEQFLPAWYNALYGSVVALSRAGLNVVVDVGHHEGHSRRLGILDAVARHLEVQPAFFIGIRCPLHVIMARRDAGAGMGETHYVTSRPDGAVPEEVLRWERAVHQPGIYDLEVDTSVFTPIECAAAIGERIHGGPPTAFRRLAETDPKG